jgi:hypothetical protein
MSNKDLEFILSGCIFTGENEVTLDELNDVFIELCESRGWEFCGMIMPLEEE